MITKQTVTKNAKNIYAIVCSGTSFLTHRPKIKTGISKPVIHIIFRNGDIVELLSLMHQLTSSSVLQRIYM